MTKRYTVTEMIAKLTLWVFRGNCLSNLLRQRCACKFGSILLYTAYPTSSRSVPTSSSISWDRPTSHKCVAQRFHSLPGYSLCLSLSSPPIIIIMALLRYGIPTIPTAVQCRCMRSQNISSLLVTWDCTSVAISNPITQAIP